MIFRAVWSWAAIVAAGSSAAGCATNDAAREEMARLVAAIERVREVPNAQKAEQLEALAVVPCERACDLKQMCVGAFSAYVLALPSAVSRSAAPRQLEDLARAERDLLVARQKVEDCTTLEFREAARLDVTVTARPVQLGVQ